MPRNGGYLYATTDANGKKVGINTDEIGAVLSVASHDVGTLGRSAKVNKWNKNKPYRRTTPEVPSRTVDNATNGTGKFCGNRGQATGYPVYWGMRYPMNTAQQNPSGYSQNTLLEICYYVGMQAGVQTNYQNYVYQKPVVDVDYCSEDDFDGYNQNAKAFLDAGVTGASVGTMVGTTSTSKLTINKYDDTKLFIYAIIPSDSHGFAFKDLIPEPDKYYLVAEFYKESQWTANSVKSSTTAPFHVAYSENKSLDTTDPSIQFDVPLSTLWQKLGNPNSDFTFYVCIGFNKRSGSGWASGAAFVAPWDYTNYKCATKVTVYKDSPWVITIQGYTPPKATVTESSYVAFSTTNINANFDSILFKTSFYNGGLNSVTIYTDPNVSGLAFRAFASGNYGQYHNDNGGHLSAGGSDTQGAPRALKVGFLPNVSSTQNNVTIGSKATETVYFKLKDTNQGLLPYGNTTAIIFQVSNDGGSTWSTVGMVACNFTRVP